MKISLRPVGIDHAHAQKSRLTDELRALTLAVIKSRVPLDFQAQVFFCLFESNAQDMFEKYNI